MVDFVSRTVDGCSLCARVTSQAVETSPAVIWTREHSVAVVGDHQYFRGYAMIIAKPHVREMHTLPSSIQESIFRDVMELGAAINQAYRPWKINYASLGNVEEHLHWHVIPRYDDDPEKKDNPWKNVGLFGQHKSTEAAAREVVKTLRAVKA